MRVEAAKIFTNQIKP